MPKHLGLSVLLAVALAVPQHEEVYATLDTGTYIGAFGANRQ